MERSLNPSSAIPMHTYTQTNPSSEASEPEILTNSGSNPAAKSAVAETEPAKPVPDQTASPPETGKPDSRLTNAMAHWALSRM